MRPMKAERTGSLLPVLFLLVAMLALAGCGGGDDSTEPTTAEGTPGSAGSGSDGGSATGPDASPDKESGGGDGGLGNGTQSSGGSSSDGQGSNVPQQKNEAEPGITPEQRRKATTASITLESPAFGGGAALPRKYTCDGGSESPPLKWSGLPSDAAELVLFVLNFKPVDEALFFNWAVAGLDPDLEEIEEGKLPSGAVVGTNSFGKRGYALCPPQKGTGETYMFLLYAIPEALSPEEDFDPLPLREAVVKQAGNVGLLAVPYGGQ